MRKHTTQEKHKIPYTRIDASVKSFLTPRFWSVVIVFAPFFGLLAVASGLRYDTFRCHDFFHAASMASALELRVQPCFHNPGNQGIVHQHSRQA